MARLVTWAERPLDDVDALAEYIARDSEKYARAVVRAMVAAGRRLERFPFSGHVVRGTRCSTIREILVYSDRVIY